MPSLTPVIRQIAEASSVDAARALPAAKAAWKAGDDTDRATIQWAIRIRSEEPTWRVHPPDPPRIPDEDAARGLRWVAYARGMMVRKGRV